MTSLRAALVGSIALAPLCLSSACLTLEPQEGRIRCNPATVATDCPTGWSCVDERCYRTAVDAGTATDAFLEGMDAPGLDAAARPDAPGVDAPGLDAPGLDAPAHDSPIVESDAPGLDAFALDVPAVLDDAFVVPDAYSECMTNADCDDGNSCTVESCDSMLCVRGPRDCDDGFSCTLDSCAEGSGCVHSPDPAMMCTTGFRCEPTHPSADASGCVPQSACTMASQCDDANPCTVDACGAGMLCTNTPRTCTPDASACTSAPVCNPTSGVCEDPFDPTSLGDPLHCGTSAAVCVAPCPTAGTNTVATCAGGTCGVSCATNFHDIDGLPGCEYSCTRTGSVDPPDLGSVDANCDGADGVVGTDLYVAPLGSDSTSVPGTNPSAPVSLARAFTLAAARAVIGMPTTMLLSNGPAYTTSTPLMAPSGLVMFGGYAPGYRTRSPRTLINSTRPTVMVIQGVSVTIDSVDMTSSDGGAPGAATRALVVIDSPATVLRNLEITAGRGGGGADGAAGTGMTTRAATGASGGNAPSGGSGTYNGGGGGGSGASSGGDGGDVTTTSARDGADGEPPDSTVCAASMMGGDGGAATTAHSCPCDTNTSPTSADGDDGDPGCPGARGRHGAGGSGPGVVGADGMWRPAAAEMGGVGEAGIAGAGGGGGAGVRCSGGAGGGGGGGGAGGLGGVGGGAGSPGQGGGASIAIVAAGSTLTLTTVRLVTGQGGVGGGGGAGGVGQPGGLGGNGGTGRQTPTASCGGTAAESVQGGNGGDGGDGGSGGGGGCGGGGAGGPSVGIFSVASSVSGSGITYTLGTGGGGGVACTTGGQAGVMGTVREQVP